jgi:hypothetical protein
MSDGIKPHCMGTAFPEDVNCLLCGRVDDRSRRVGFCSNSPYCRKPSAADLDAVAEEQRVKEETE